MIKLELLFLLAFSVLIDSWRTQNVPEDFKGMYYPCDDYYPDCKIWSKRGWCLKSKFFWMYCGRSCKSCNSPYTCIDGRNMSTKTQCPEFKKSKENEMKVPITTNRPNISEHGSCGNPLSHQQIVMGGVSEPPHFDSRWHVTLFMRKKPTQTSLGDSSTCSGSLIRDNVILTSAHCVQNAEESGWFVYAGFSGAVQAVDGEKREVDSFVIPMAFPSRISWDLALVFLKDPFVLSDKIATIPLMKSEHTTIKNQEWRQCQFSGTGQILSADGKTCQRTSLKFYAKGILVARDCCQAVRPLFNDEHDADTPYPIDVGCFRGASQMGCSGDSGAGITCSRSRSDTNENNADGHVLIGIHRGGAPCCVPDKDNVDVLKVVNQPVEKVIIRLDKSRLKWIKSQIGAYDEVNKSPVRAPE